MSLTPNMSLTNVTYKAVLLMGTLLLTGCETVIETPFAAPTPFAAAPYCSSVDRTKALVIPETVTATLDADKADEEAVANALLVKAAMEIAHASDTVEACEASLEAGEAKFLQSLAAQRDVFATLGGFKPAKDPDILSVQTDMTRLWREDQSARQTYIGLGTEDKTGADFWAQRLATAHATRVDAGARVPVKAYVDEYGWIDRVRFGAPVSNHAWILVQHADDHPDFQQAMLDKMTPYVERGEASPKNYAYLWDRVAVNTGREQRYGTQPNWECDDNGKMELRALENPETVNQRRAEVGLNSVEEGLAEMERSVCGIKG